MSEWIQIKKQWSVKTVGEGHRKAAVRDDSFTDADLFKVFVQRYDQQSNGMILKEDMKL